MNFSEQIVVVFLRNFDVLGDVTRTHLFTKTRRSNWCINVSKNQPAIIQWRHSILFLAKLHPNSSNPSNFICNSTFCRSFSHVRIFTSFNVKVNFSKFRDRRQMGRVSSYSNVWENEIDYAHLRLLRQLMVSFGIISAISSYRFNNSTFQQCFFHVAS